MDVTTSSYSLSPNKYFEILVVNRLRGYWWVYLGMFILAIVNLSSFGEDNFATFIVVFGLIYPIFIVAYLYYWATSKKNEALFIPRQLTVNEDKIETSVEDGSSGNFSLQYVQRIVHRKNYFLLYMAKGQFVYIPKSAFKSKEDLRRFEAIISELPQGK